MSEVFKTDELKAETSAEILRKCGLRPTVAEIVGPMVGAAGYQIISKAELDRLREYERAWDWLWKNRATIDHYYVEKGYRVVLPNLNIVQGAVAATQFEAVKAAMGGRDE